jgi:hypothetical protein
MEREVPELRNSKAVLVDFAFGGDSDATDREDAGVEVIYAPSARPLVKQVNAETQRMLKFNVFLPGVLDEGIQLGNSFSELVYKAGRPHKLVGRVLQPRRLHLPESAGWYACAGAVALAGGAPRDRQEAWLPLRG